MTNENIAVIGSGSWGTALAVLLAENNQSVTLWVRRKELYDKLVCTRENSDYLPGVVLPDNLQINYDLQDTVSNKSIIVSVVPTHATREIAQRIVDYIDSRTIVVNASKGFEIDSLKTMSQVLAEVLFEGDRSRIAVLSGPNHAEEVSKQIPSASVIAAQKRNIATKLQNVFMTKLFRVYTNPDINGVEIGGALKNIMALGTGISDGLGFGDNTKAAFMTRGIYEISRLGTTLNARPMTFAGLAGIGDLIVTCTSDHSRNRRAGKLIGGGKTLEQVLESTNMVVEGVKTTEAAHYLSKEMGVEMPITEELYDILFNNKPPLEGVKNLMERVEKNEMEEVVDSNLWID